MTDLLDRAIKSALQDFFDAAPERSDTPLEPAHRSPRSPSRTTLIAAATVVVVGVGGLLAVRLGDDPAGSGAVTTPETTEAATITYTVVSGDYLANIAERHCVTMDEIANFNNWSDGADHLLFPDQVILIPPGGCVPDSTPLGSLPTEDPADFAARATPTAFPVVAETPQRARPTGAFSAIPVGESISELLIGRIENSTIVDAVIIEVGPTRESIGPTDPSGESTTVLGQDATLIPDGGLSNEYDDIVIWGDEPAFVAIGEDPVAFLGQLASDAIQASLPAEPWLPPDVTIGELPDGYEVIVDSQVVGAGGLGANLLVGNNEIYVSTRNMLPGMTTAGTVRSVDINGMTGWMFVSENPSSDVSWQVDDATYAYLKINDDMTPDESLALARSVTFVPAGEWMTLYDVPLPAFPPGPTTSSGLG